MLLVSGCSEATQRGTARGFQPWTERRLLLAHGHAGDVERENDRAVADDELLRADQIGSVFMTGGSSGLPVLRACVQAALPGVAIVTGDMLGSVGTGLALDARRKFG